MKIRNKLIGLAALLVVVIFMASSTVPAVNVNSHNKEMVSDGMVSNYNSVYSTHMIRNPRNASELLSNAFLAYYIHNQGYGKSTEQLANGIHSVSESEMKTLFSSFLKSSSYARSLLALHTKHLKEKFAILDKSMAARLSNELNNGKNGNTHPFKTNSKNTKLVSIRTTNNAPSIPGWALSSPGQYEYVVINYFTWHIYISWFAQYSITYGEQDIIYSLYTGSAAENYYNNVTFQLGIEGVVLASLVAYLVGEIVDAVAALADITISNSLANAITAASGISTGLQLLPLILAYTTVYESDYANQNSGHKYMFLYETSDYYYPWIEGPVSQASSFGVTGILSNGNTINIMPVGGWFSVVPGLPTLYAQYVSDCCNGFGTGQWKYVGS